jgi:hypothetical protein
MSTVHGRSWGLAEASGMKRNFVTLALQELGGENDPRFLCHDNTKSISIYSTQEQYSTRLYT